MKYHPGQTNTIANWHELIEKRDPTDLSEILAEDLVFYSPVVHTPQIGKLRTLPYLHAAFHVFLNETFRYVREIVCERDAVLEFEVELDDITVNGVDMLKWNDDGKIIEFKVMLRPLKAVNLIHEKMAAVLAGRRSDK